MPAHVRRFAPNHPSLRCGGACATIRRTLPRTDDELRVLAGKVAP